MPGITGVVVALDLASRTGFAIGRPDGDPVYGQIVLPPGADNIARFAVAFEDWFSEMLDTQVPALVVFEAPIMPRMTQLATLRKLYGLAYDVERQCGRRGIRCREGRAASVRKFFVGNGHAKKDDTVAICQRYGWKPESDDAADALALWAYSCCKVAPEHARRFALGPLGAGKTA